MRLARAKPVESHKALLQERHARKSAVRIRRIVVRAESQRALRGRSAGRIRQAQQERRRYFRVPIPTLELLSEIYAQDVAAVAVSVVARVGIEPVPAVGAHA